MYRQRLTLTALTLLPLAMACGNETAGDAVRSDAGPDLAGTYWTVDSATVDGTTQRAPAGARVEIGDHGKVQGNYGCNHFNATATFKDGRLDLGPVTSTEMACEKAPMKFESTLARTLSDGALITKVADDALTLTTGAGDRVRLTKEKDASLYGTKWTVMSLGDGDVAQSLPKGADGKAYLVLDKKKGTLGGRFGCNHGSAKATVRDGHITLGRPTTTRMMCDGSLMDTEKRLLGLFDGKPTYALDHRTLTLTSANGEKVTAVADK
ncbi:META domain-containing protein [Streptomyces sp. NPDC058274]|uniref:META domain-containing protein n=1 Tax=Streptomyces sp. NPDC058274 TaxID=3346416 RepID=UPI0036E1963C